MYCEGCRAQFKAKKQDTHVNQSTLPPFLKLPKYRCLGNKGVLKTQHSLLNNVFMACIKMYFLLIFFLKKDNQQKQHLFKHLVCHVPLFYNLYKKLN